MLVKQIWAKIFSYSALLITYNLAYAATNKPISLQEAIQIALKENLNIQIAENTRKGAIFSNRMATLNLWAPKATFLLSQDNQWEKETKNTHLLQSNPIFTLSWKLKSVVDKIFQTKHYDQQHTIDRLTAAKAIEDELQKVVTCHYELALAQKKEERFHTFIEIAATKLKIEEERFRLGFSSRVDSLNADLVLKQAKLTLLEHQEILKEKCRNLNLVLGKPINKETLVEADISVQPVWDITTVGKVVDLEAAIQEKKVAIATTELTKVKCYPLSCLSLLAEIRSNGYTYHFNDGKWRNHPSKAMLSISIGVDVGGLFLMPSKIRQAKMALNNEIFKLDQHKRLSEGILENKKWKYHHMLGLHKLVQEKLKVSGKKLLLVKENYKSNQIKLLDLQEAEEEMQKAEINLIEYAFKVKQAEFELYTLIGNLNKRV
ncbi:TolC family protein [Candidatus Cardinium sp. TP]|uniref:TolC family protein n=1 Tax=Candidatus Cardinium sp. TP TaxID=2961955 RepID=UPI0021AF2285|nr:TolC family protein [Candidatus Cardinium sp. TP]MCT4697512.1 TolC family protein [Candidatus Cardinium sp. TP]